MIEADAYQLLTNIFDELFADDSIVLRPDMSAKDIEGWDLFTHLQLIVAVETRCGFRFSTSEIERLPTVRDLVAVMVDRAR